MAKMEGYAVTITYSAPFSHPKTFAEAKEDSARCRRVYPGGGPHRGAIWRLYDDGTRKMVKKGGEE